MPCLADTERSSPHPGFRPREQAASCPPQARHLHPSESPCTSSDAAEASNSLGNQASLPSGVVSPLAQLQIEI